MAGGSPMLSMVTGETSGLRAATQATYQVSILEVAGSSATSDEIVAMESLWKQKLQSREMGINRNLCTEPDVRFTNSV